MAEVYHTCIIVHRTLLCAGSDEDVNEGQYFAAKQKVMKSIEGVLCRLKTDVSKTVLLVSGEITTDLNAVASKYNATIKGMENTEAIEDMLIGSKQMIDDLSVSTLYMVIPDSHMNYCKTVSSFIFNTHTYQVGFEGINVGLPTKSNVKNEESVLESIREKLKHLPSSDGLPLKTLKTMLIPNDRFYHGYTTITGGVSTHPTMRSLPLAMSLRKKDTKVYIEENRRRLAEAEGFDVLKFESASAVHGIHVWVIGDEQPKSYDAIVTDKPGYTIAAPGADCQTLLFCDPVKMVVGAAHSGWKGTIDRIQQNVVRVMKDRFGCKPSDILVAIGPSIGVCCYNVDENRAKEFIDGVAESVVQRREGTPYLDLWQATKILLAEVGVKTENIDGGNSFRYNMKQLVTSVAIVLMACVASNAVPDCGGNVPMQLCTQLKNIEDRLGHLVLSSTSLITKAVEDSANRNAVLFSKTVRILRNATKTRPMNETEFMKILNDLQKTFEDAEKARRKISSQATKHVGDAAERFVGVVQKILKTAVDEDHSNSTKFQEKLNKMVKRSFGTIKFITLKAVNRVYDGNMQAEQHVVHVLEKLKFSHASEAQRLATILGIALNRKLAEEAEREIEAELEETTNDLIQLIIKSDSGISKRDFQQFWAYVKSKLSALSGLLLLKVKEAVARMAPQIYQKIGEIVKIIINEAKRALVEIAGEIVMVTVP